MFTILRMKYQGSFQFVKVAVDERRGRRAVFPLRVTDSQWKMELHR